VKAANGVQSRTARRIIPATGIVVCLAVLLISTASLVRRSGSSGLKGQAQNAGTTQLRVRNADRPLSFEPNLGQADRSVKFLSRGGEQSVFLRPDGALLMLRRNATSLVPRKPKIADEQLHRGVETAPFGRDFLRRNEPEQTGDNSVLAMHVVGANPRTKIAGLAELPGKSNYFVGSDPKNWRTNVPNYAKVQYENIYHGINLVYYGNQRRLEYDFAVGPGADPAQIRLGFNANSQGQSNSLRLILEPNGDLAIDVDGREIQFQKPVVYQLGEQGAQIPIEAKYVARGNNEIGFEIGKYDPNKLLIIDPTLLYSTYFGGNQHDQGFGVKLDASGNILLTGATASTNFPLKNAFQTAAGGNLDVFVSKFDPTGTTLIYSTYLAGSGDDLGEGIALDPSGDAYVTGWTASPNFPTKNALQPALAGAGATNDFLAEFDPNGGLIFSTYFGGTGTDHCYSVAVDASGVYVAGDTSSTDYPTKVPFQATKLGTQTDAFLTKFTTDGSSVIYSTYLGGAGPDTQAYTIAIDSSQSAYVAGQTSSTSFPIKNAFQTTNAGNGAEVFVTKFSPDGQSLVYSTFLGGTGFQSAGDVFVDSSGDAYISGGTTSSDFPITPNAWQPKFVGVSGDFDAYVTEFAPSGSALIFSTYIGGSNNDFADGVHVDSQGNVHIAGYTESTDFPTTPDAFQPTNGGTWNGFVAEFNSTGSILLFSSYIGGSGVDVADTITLDSSGNAWISGTEDSTNFPVTSNAFQSTYGGGNDDAYLANIAAVPTSALTVTLAGSGSGTVTSSPPGMNCGTVCSETFASGATVTLTATPASGSEFIGWTSGPCSGTGTCTVTMNSAESVTATFDPPSLPLTVTLTGSGSGTVSSAPSGITCGATCSASFTTGSQVTLTAAPAAGSEFTGWSGACTGMSTCAVTMSAAQQATATFAPIGFTLTANPTTLNLQPGAQGTSTITVSLKTAGIGSAVQLTCAVSGSTSTCGLSPTSVTPAASSATSKLTITAPTMAALRAPRPHPHTGFGAYALWLPMAAFGIVLIGGLGKRRGRIAICYGVLFLLLAFQFACSSNSNSTTSTNYTVTITGASGSVQQTTQVSVSVP